ncbi:MAG: penicillin acylase family protein [Nocardioides sp.]
MSDQPGTVSARGRSDAPPPGRRASSWVDALRGWPRAGRWSVYAVIGLVLLLVAGAVGVGALVRRPLPETSGEIDLPGLSAPVEVVRDDQGIPQLYADTLDDLMMAQGYVHAQERFFEMDVRRHVTAGRLSELFGEETLETDKAIRTMGWRRVAERELALIEPRTRMALESYADGVNAYLDQRSPSQLAVEYSLLRLGGLDYTPEDWSPVDSLAWLKAMAWDLRGNMGDEIGRALAAVDHSASEVDQLYPAYPYDTHPPIVSGGAVVDGVFDQDATGGTRNPERPAPGGLDEPDPRGHGEAAALESVGDVLDAVPALVGVGDGVGSNSWVVGPERSQTGAPLLANDPHLGVSLPGIWMQMGLHCRSITAECPMQVAGFTFSGVPGVVIGHNADIAWGFTNLGPDVTDLFLERVRGNDWRYDRRWRPLLTRTETIKVRAADDFELRIRETDHGPLLSDVSEELSSVAANSGAAVGLDASEGLAVSLAWTALRPSTTADAILELNLASDWEEFRTAAADFAVPAQNLVYADRAGHIGYQAPGQVPIRQSGNDGSVPSAGWRPENDWTGDFVPFDGLPNVLDPEEGYVVTANQAVSGPDYPYFLTNDWDRGYRATRIRERIEADPQLSVEEMAAIQLDDRNPMAAALVPRLLDVQQLGSPYYRDGQALLGDWDYSQPADSAAAAYYNAVWRALLRITFHDDLRESLWPEGGQRWFGVVEGLLREPTATWWDDTTTEEQVETRDDVLRQAMRDARDDLTSNLALDPQDWTWGDLHQLDLRTATLGESGIGLVEWIENREGYEVGGGGSIVDATGWDATVGYEVTTSPSMRMVVSLADLDDSRWISMTGVSGHPGSNHYVDQTDLWVDGETLPWAFSRSAVEGAGADTLMLVPAGE